MSRMVQLLGRPSIHGIPGGYQMRSRKSWALLTYLLLSERPPTRTQLAALLFEQADDPLGALRWGLAEIRRALGDGALVEGDPVVLRLPPRTVVDVEVITRHSWVEAVEMPALGAQLLEGLTVRSARRSSLGCFPSSTEWVPPPRRFCTRPPSGPCLAELWTTRSGTPYGCSP